VATETFADNLERLLAMHRLTARQFAAITDVSESVVSKWLSGDRNPSFASALKVADVFKIDPGRLARADFGDLLTHELADAERYRHVENHIRNVKRKLEREGHVVLPPKRTRQKGAR